MWQEAASMAARLHQGQVRKDGATPYAAHCWRVAMTIRHTFGCAEEPTLAAALLHDVIEDTTADYDDIAESFSTEVADLVAAMTKNMALPESLREPQYDAQLAAADWRARLIKLADTYDNLAEAGPAERAKAAEKARRAMVLAGPDTAAHPEAAAGVEALRALLER